MVISRKSVCGLCIGEEDAVVNMDKCEVAVGVEEDAGGGLALLGQIGAAEKFGEAVGWLHVVVLVPGSSRGGNVSLVGMMSSTSFSESGMSDSPWNAEVHGISSPWNAEVQAAASGWLCRMSSCDV